MNNQIRNLAAALALVTIGYAGSAAAEDHATYVSDAGDVIHCESNKGRIDSCSRTSKSKADADDRHVVHCVATGSARTYCGDSPVQFVVKGGGHNPACVEGSTWGIDQGKLWVSGGCAAFF